MGNNDHKPYCTMCPGRICVKCDHRFFKRSMPKRCKGNMPYGIDYKREYHHFV